jgi:hypothetical protein
MHAFDTVDAFLLATYRLRLEDVLCEGCAMGRLSVVLAERATIVPRLVQSLHEEDGGIANDYEGILVLDGVWYRFRCHLFIDPSGQRFLTDVTGFEAVEWRARMAMPA